MRIYYRIFSLTLFIIYFLFNPFSLLEIHGQEEHTGGNPIMLALSKAIRDLDKGLANDSAEVVLSYLEALKKAAGEMSALKPQKNQDMVRLFNEYRTKIGWLSLEMVSFARKKSLARVSQVLKEVRHTCISCHVKFRISNDAYGFYPARANTITGEVKILKENGKERSDRSNVVVFLDRVNCDTSFPLPRKNPVISQKNRSFIPRVLPVMKGTTVDFLNDDTIFHNVFSLSRTKPFDLDIYPPGKSKSVIFPTPGWVKIYCNIHPNMIAHIIVLDNPFFSLTDQKGIFVISSVPDGEYTLRTWHEFGKEVRKEIKISGSLLYRYFLEIQEDKKFVQHKNKFGKSYRWKYK